MTRRETRVVNAFVNCVRSGEFTEDYAITLIEDNQRYGWMSEAAKEAFYTALDEIEQEKVNIAETVEFADGDKVDEQSEVEEHHTDESESDAT